MFGKLGHIMGKVARWAGATLAALAIGLPAAMYIPWVQNKVADIAADIASKKTGMDISVGDVRVRFPLDVSATDVQVIDQNGDTLFRASIGRTDFPGGDHQTLMKSIRGTLFALPADTAAYPGHGPATAIGDERLNNPFIGDFAED